MILSGKEIAENIEDTIKTAIQHLKGRPPALAFIRVGDNPASLSYIKMKKKKCHKVGITSIDIELAENTSEETLLKEIDTLNKDPAVDGILVQLPLPTHIHTHKIICAVDPLKDIDGFHPYNMGKLLLGEKDGFISCTPYGIEVLLHHAKVDLEGKHVVILGRSNIVGKPLAALLMQKEKGANATVTIAHSKTKNLPSLCQSADVLIAAMGNPHFVKASMVKEGAIVIDVGINRTKTGLIGDVDFPQVAPKCQLITPVPGGVGPMTIAMLLSNTLLSYQRKQ